MTFNSFTYFLFLPAVYLVFYFTSQRWRWLVLLVASYAFYASLRAPYLLAVLVAVTGIGYTCGLRIAEQEDGAARVRSLWLGILSCLFLLFALKYLPFGLGSTLSPTIVTIGVSYFTFQAVSYLADVYLGTAQPERHLGHYALYLAFFPKLLQGPIERAQVLMPQLKEPYRFDYHAMRSGMLLFTWGLFKKMVVADRLALYADRLDHVHNYPAAALVFSVYAYAFQIYFDFAGYTDMARGSARMFGIELSENFNSPYLATSVAEFWRRWHITFSRWIFEYVFAPLQMTWRRLRTLGTALALVVTFLVSGLWHGATSGFLAWGLLHGIYMAASVYYRPLQKRLYRRLGIEGSGWIRCWQVFVTFHLVSLAWIFFRTGSLADAWHVLGACATLFRTGLQVDVFSWLGDSDLCLLLLSLLAVLLVRTVRMDFYGRNVWFRWLSYNALIFSILVLGVTGKSSYIYFSF